MEPRVAEEYARFDKFLNEIILPCQPAAFVARSKFHNELVLRAVKKMTATAAPRGFLKSTTLAKYRALHRLVDPLSRPELGIPPDIMMASETTRLSKEHLEWVKAELTSNPLLLKKYGYLADPQSLTWKEDEIKLRNGARCIGLGYGSQVRGRHPTDIIVDDLEGLENMGTEESLEKLKDWFYRVLMGSMTPETHLTVIGTIIARQSLLSELVTHEEFDGRVFRALEKDPMTQQYTSLWPERYPVKLLLRLRKTFGVHRFNAEYQNEPLGLKDQIIFYEWLRHHDQNALASLKPVRRFMAIDPAFTEERWGDYSAIVVLDQVNNGMLYERLAWRKKVALPELRDTIISFYRHFSMDCQVTIGIEEVAAQKGVRQSVQELDPTINLVSMRPDKDKARRLIDVSRYFEMGLVSLMTPSFEDELLNFPMGDKDRCFVAGTMVATSGGERRIEELKAGEEVLTPFGNTIIEVISKHRTDKKIITKFGLTATEDHKIFTYENGFISLQEANTSVSIISVKEMILWKLRALLYLKVKDISCLERKDITSLNLNRKASGLLKDCMWQFGNFIMEKEFRKAMLFITKMVTSVITPLLTLSVYHARNMLKNIGSQYLKNKKNIYPESDLRQQCGIDQRKEESGTRNIQKNNGRIRKLTTKFASGVKNLLKDFISILSPAAEPVSTPCSSNEEKIVYNIKTKAGVYYANNILVSNCDALVYCLKLYEMSYPVQANKAYSEIDVTKLLKAEEQQLYVERALAGEPGYSLPSSVREAYNNAMLVNDLADEWM